MKAMLNQQDAAALDLLLDHSQAASGHAATVFAPSEGAGHERVQHARKILNLLHLMQVGEPPRDLLTRTLRYVGESLDANAHVGVQLRPAITTLFVPVPPSPMTNLTF
jgi:hypothetical protein